MSDTPPWVSVPVYAQHYNADEKTVHKWLEAGLLESFRVGRFIRVRDQPPRPAMQTPTKQPEP